MALPIGGLLDDEKAILRAALNALGLTASDLTEAAEERVAALETGSASIPQAVSEATTILGQVSAAADGAGIQPDPATPTVPPSGVANGATYWAAIEGGEQLYRNTAGVGAPVTPVTTRPSKALVDAANAVAQTALQPGAPVTRLSETAAAKIFMAAERAKVAAVNLVEPVRLGGRLMQPTVVHFRSPGLLETFAPAMVALQGVFLDTGEPWSAEQPSKRVAPISVSGRMLQPLTIATPSLRVLSGIWLDTGEIFPTPVVTTQYDPDEIVIVPVGTTNINLFYKGSKPASNRYIRLNFYRFVDASALVAADVWRLGEQWECTRTDEFTFNDTRRLGNDAETDNAIWESKGVTGDSDALTSGKEHGAEIEDPVVTPLAMLDGRPIPLTAPARGRKFEFLHRTICYSWDGAISGSTFTRTGRSNRVVAVITKRHTLTSAGYQLDFSVAWGAGIALRRAYFGMGIVYRTNGGETISSVAYQEPAYSPIDLSAGAYPDTTSPAARAYLTGPIGIAWSWADLGGSMTRLSPSGRSWFRDTSNRNKHYADYSGTYTTGAAEVWSISSIQKFDTAN